MYSSMCPFQMRFGADFLGQKSILNCHPGTLSVSARRRDEDPPPPCAVCLRLRTLSGMVTAAAAAASHHRAALGGGGGGGGEVSARQKRFAAAGERCWPQTRSSLWFLPLPSHTVFADGRGKELLKWIPLPLLPSLPFPADGGNQTVADSRSHVTGTRERGTDADGASITYDSRVSVRRRPSDALLLLSVLR